MTAINPEVLSSTTCPACGEVFDVGAVGCRMCGEGIELPAQEVPDELLDELGEWSHIKHEILDNYAQAYTTIVTKQPLIRKVLYIDAYAGCGYALDRDTGEYLYGSAIRAMNVRPSFDELYFVDEDAQKAEILWGAAGADPRVFVYEG